MRSHYKFQSSLSELNDSFSTLRKRRITTHNTKSACLSLSFYIPTQQYTLHDFINTRDVMLRQNTRDVTLRQYTRHVTLRQYTRDVTLRQYTRDVTLLTGGVFDRQKSRARNVDRESSREVLDGSPNSGFQLYHVPA